jgi:hypothetical protein
VVEHPRSVASQLSQLAMGYGSGGTDGIAFFPGGVRLSQPHNQVFNQLGKISGTFLVGTRDEIK